MTSSVRNPQKFNNGLDRGKFISQCALVQMSPQHPSLSTILLHANIAKTEINKNVTYSGFTKTHK